MLSEKASNIPSAAKRAVTNVTVNYQIGQIRRMLLDLSPSQAYWVSVIFRTLRRDCDRENQPANNDIAQGNPQDHVGENISIKSLRERFHRRQLRQNNNNDIDRERIQSDARNIKFGSISPGNGFPKG